MIPLSYKSALSPLLVLPGACISVRSEFVDSYIKVPKLVSNNISAVVCFVIEVICCPNVLTAEVPTYI
jgi:hypothetical protein